MWALLRSVSRATAVEKVSQSVTALLQALIQSPTQGARQAVDQSYLTDQARYEAGSYITATGHAYLPCDVSRDLLYVPGDSFSRVSGF